VPTPEDVPHTPSSDQPGIAEQSGATAAGSGSTREEQIEGLGGCCRESRAIDSKEDGSAARLFSAFVCHKCRTRWEGDSQKRGQNGSGTRRKRKPRVLRGAPEGRGSEVAVEAASVRTALGVTENSDDAASLSSSRSRTSSHGDAASLRVRKRVFVCPAS
jgi:hypothetical protein